MRFLVNCSAAWATAVIVVVTLVPRAYASGGMTQINPPSLLWTSLIDFNGLDVSAGGPGTNVDDVLALAGASFSERFVGQAVSMAGANDVLSGLPSNPLTMIAGSTGQNLLLADISIGQGPPSTVISGISGLGGGFPDTGAIEKGALSVLFEDDQIAVGFDLIASPNTAVLLQFFRRDGYLIDTASVTGPTTGEVVSLAFARDGGILDVAGLSITTSTADGARLDNFLFDPIPEPSTLTLAALGLLGLGSSTRLRKS